MIRRIHVNGWASMVALVFPAGNPNQGKLGGMIVGIASALLPPNRGNTWLENILWNVSAFSANNWSIPVVSSYLTIFQGDQGHFEQLFKPWTTFPGTVLTAFQDGATVDTWNAGAQSLDGAGVGGKFLAWPDKPKIKQPETGSILAGGSGYGLDSDSPLSFYWSNPTGFPAIPASQAGNPWDLLPTQAAQRSYLVTSLGGAPGAAGQNVLGQTFPGMSSPSQTMIKPPLSNKGQYLLTGFQIAVPELNALGAGITDLYGYCSFAYDIVWETV